MKIILTALLMGIALSSANTVIVPDSISPDNKISAVMDIDRDPTISPEWKEGSFPQIELTDRITGLVLASIEYFGSVADDARPLREHVQVKWRSDSKAFAVTVNDRFYSSSKVFAMTKDSKFIEVDLPDYETMTGFPSPDIDDLEPRGRVSVKGWDPDGHLIFYIRMTPAPSYTGNDPLEHTVLLSVAASGMIPAKKIKKQNKSEMATPRKPSD